MEHLTFEISLRLLLTLTGTSKYMLGETLLGATNAESIADSAVRKGEPSRQSRLRKQQRPSFILTKVRESPNAHKQVGILRGGKGFGLRPLNPHIQHVELILIKDLVEKSVAKRPSSEPARRKREVEGYALAPLRQGQGTVRLLERCIQRLLRVVRIERTPWGQEQVGSNCPLRVHHLSQPVRLIGRAKIRSVFQGSLANRIGREPKYLFIKAVALRVSDTKSRHGRLVEKRSDLLGLSGR
ncbi:MULTISPECIES: hypothetical protein [Streptomyces]|uniref:Uncharacterized protein n=1 Tax=Streptomyces doudnae TaxID=3075536 RepID=A0ABD5EIG0_9ACTN|nr:MULTISPECIES: hypothetical protein [unclassified Streptomyces]MDT0434073.1 hypothetical protein [Streptomyces sp. DSM 41981]MYQ64997.1 hypothetical protein [Streptomyces sp. SID4950]